MTDPDRLDRLRGYFHTGEIPVAKPDCLDAHTVAALADGTLDAASRARALTHVATCVHCRRAVASVAEALLDGPITHEIEIVEGRRHPGRHLFRIAVPLAAAAIVLLLVWSPARDNASAHRGDQAAAAGSVPVLLGPIGTVARASQLRWSSVAGADRYRMTLFNAQGVVVYETQVSDTLVVLPDSVRLVPGQPYLWKVEARTGWDRWLASELVEFTISRAPPAPPPR